MEENTINTPSITREQWLQLAVEKLRPYFKRYKLTIAPKIAVSCGFPGKGGLSTTRPRLGECWSDEVTFDGTRHILVSPRISDPVRVLDILCHEALHASLPDDVGHGPNFKAAAKELGLEGPPSATTAGIELKGFLTKIAEELGDYPNSAITIPDKPKETNQKKSTFKLFCQCKRDGDKKCHLLDKSPGKDYTVSVGKKNLELGMPLCPCGYPMMLEPDDYKAWQETLKQEGKAGTEIDAIQQ